MQRVRTLFSVYVFHHILYSLPLRAILSLPYTSRFMSFAKFILTRALCEFAQMRVLLLRARAVQHWEKSQTHAALENAVSSMSVFVRGEKKKKPFQVLS